MDLIQQLYRRHWMGYYSSHLMQMVCPTVIKGLVSQTYLVWFFVYAIHLGSVVSFLKKFNAIQLQALLDITVVDTPVASYDGRFSLLYTFWCYRRGMRYIVRTFTHSDGAVPSLTVHYSSSGWLEREAWDLFGIKFYSHNDLRRILTDYGFRGHPLRKDFPLMGFVEIRYDDSYGSLLFEPVELSQEFRFWKFEMPWALWPEKLNN